jgi:hypothetical protein
MARWLTGMKRDRQTVTVLSCSAFGGPVMRIRKEFAEWHGERRRAILRK